MKYVIYTAFLLLFIGCKSDNEELIKDLGNTLNAWSWIDIEGMFCRDGSATGIGLYENPNSKSLVIFLQGGGACFDASTCDDNPSFYNNERFTDYVNRDGLSRGIFNSTNDKNPLKGWNAIYIPYCTGDVHIGNTENGAPLGVGKRQLFVGHRNIATMLAIMAPYFRAKGINQVVLAGISAGGFGTLLNYIQVSEAFEGIDITLLNDSAPLPNDESIFPTVLQLAFSFIYKIPVPHGVIGCCNSGSILSETYGYLRKQYPNGKYAFMSYTDDDVIRFFFGVTGEITGEQYRSAMFKLRDEVLIPNNWSSYLVEGEGHTFTLSDNRFFNTNVNNVALSDFVANVLKGEVNHISE